MLSTPATIPLYARVSMEMTGTSMRRTRDLDELERRRIAGVALLRKGATQAEVARRLDVSRQSVNRWALVLAEKGVRALRRAPHRGRAPRLTERQRERVHDLLRAGTSPWKLAHVNALIERQFGVSYQRSRLIKFLRDAGFRPRARAGWIRACPTISQRQ